MKIAVFGRHTVAAMLLLIVAGCGPRDDGAATRGEPNTPAAQQAASQSAQQQTGTATVYAGALQGQETAGGTSFNHEELVAAHHSHELGTEVRVTNLENDRSVTVRIVDRIPARTGAVVDLSRRAARELGIDEGASAQVRVEVVQ
jgi:rare lipoprotein A